MKWTLNWLISILTIFVSAYFFRFYDSLSEIGTNIDFGTIIFIAIVGVISAVIGIGGSNIIFFRRFILKDFESRNLPHQFVSIIISVTLSILIVYRLSILLTET